MEPLESPLTMQSLTSLTAIDFSIQTHYKLVKVVIEVWVDQVFVVLLRGCNKFPGAV